MTTAGQQQSRLRSAVLAQAWRRIPGVEVLSAGDGGPLTRTVKKIIDPLVLRTAARPRLGRPLLAPEAAAEVTELLLADAARLGATAAWFTHLKRQRRALRITAGNVQDVCFPLAYELATSFGRPDASAPEQAAAALREWHGEDSAAAVDQLSAYLADPRATADLTAELRRRWHTTPDNPVAPDFVPLLDAVANGFADEDWQALAGSPAGHAFGLALRRPGGAAALARAVHEVSGLPAPDLGLQRGDRTAVPPLNQRDEAGGELLERSIERRVRASLRRLSAAEPASIADLVDDELSRTAAGFGLETPVLATCFVLGVVLSPALRPLDGSAPGGIPAFAQRLNAQVAREGYVLYARRALAGSTPLTARADADILRELREFAKRFLARLWVRLHGFDVSGQTPAAAADIRDLLTGVVRSTSLDLRTKVRRALVAGLPRLEAVS
ncbi:hypothetical protein G3I59_05215 [Amycolatopsis rubida]|uniref:Uncharacterized protein n=1 Tax=Amycolatopsis rubida TaxID=112413 RepID=A0ABX0BKY1_9PSEU|nr:hypothetical protein [Amycolatopsis sp. M39]MYW90033.1 hypothetical protein [Amycolatopsis rubida]NEC55010.1 hypothetical protein [Amycolatopsis rubida]OAP21111.1 hypothetical protein A4R44_08086 [Amycolatopsis sp. M39]